MTGFDKAVTINIQHGNLWEMNLQSYEEEGETGDI